MYIYYVICFAVSVSALHVYILMKDAMNDIIQIDYTLSILNASTTQTPEKPLPECIVIKIEQCNVMIIFFLPFFV